VILLRFHLELNTGWTDGNLCENKFFLPDALSIDIKAIDAFLVLLMTEEVHIVILDASNEFLSSFYLRRHGLDHVEALRSLRHLSPLSERLLHRVHSVWNQHIMKEHRHVEEEQIDVAFDASLDENRRVFRGRLPNILHKGALYYVVGLLPWLEREALR